MKERNTERNTKGAEMNAYRFENDGELVGIFCAERKVDAFNALNSDPFVRGSYPYGMALFQLDVTDLGESCSCADCPYNGRQHGARCFVPDITQAAECYKTIPCGE